MNQMTDDLLQCMCSAKNIAVLTGAGISAESGIATFRGKDGIWNKMKPEELASMNAFLQNPARVLQWYEHRRSIIENVRPNAAHTTLAEMEKAFPVFTISTQNIDGLHTRAGSSTVYELHGNILRNKCSRCNQMVTGVTLADMPKCECGGVIRPDVVWFGEMLPMDILDKAYEAARQADIYFSIGTSAAVYPAAHLPYEAKDHGAFVIEINLEPTALSSHADVSVQGRAGHILPLLWRSIQNELNFKN